MQIAVIGGGPAGLTAAQAAAEAGAEVTVYEAKPSLGRKFLLAGRSGLNLTHAEDFEAFVRRYDRAEVLPYLRDFTPQDLRDFFGRIGVETFVGSSGRVFPVEFKASAALRRWLRHLADLGVKFQTQARWQGWAGGRLIFDIAGQRLEVAADATVLALGGASWPRMGSDAGWMPLLRAEGIEIADFQPSNCGVLVPWSSHIADKFAGAPLKNITLRCGAFEAGGEIVITRYGLEGGPVYALSGPIRQALAQDGRAALRLDLKRDLDLGVVQERLTRVSSSLSLSNRLKKGVGLSGPVASLVRECAGDLDLAEALKALPVTVSGLRPIEEAISSAGGVRFGEIRSNLELRKLPGVFVCGEMLDWDAPTGGYLLQACFSTGRAAGRAAVSPPCAG